MAINLDRWFKSAFSSLVVAGGIVGGLLAFSSHTAHAAEDPSTEMKTIGGVLRVVNEQFSPHLVLNKKKISGIDNDSITLKQKFNVAGNDVVLVQQNCSGSSCSYSNLNFVTITSTGKITVSESMDADEGGTAEVKAVGDTLIIKTETYEGRRKKTSTWIYANGNVKKTK